MFDPHAADPEPERILVVDDEETIRNLLAVVVGSLGAVADLAEDGAAATRLLRENEYACALLDKNLPDISGMELLALLKKDYPDTETLIVTGYANLDSAVQALRLGACDYIVKPFEMEVVTHRVRIALDQRRLKRQLATLAGELQDSNAELAQARQETSHAYTEAVTRLSLAAEFDDPQAQGHIQRIARYSAIVARLADAPQDWTDRILNAAPLHDIGMIAVPDRLRRKPERLTADESKQMQEHVHIGAKILHNTTADVLIMAREIVLSHHEKWDGGGYPDGKKGTEIPFAGRIVALADAWDALTTHRVYRPAMSFDDAIEEIRRSAGSHFDPQLVELFLDNQVQVRAVLENSD